MSDKIEFMTRQEMLAKGLITVDEIKAQFSDIIDFSKEGAHEDFEEALDSFCNEYGYKTQMVNLWK